MLFMISLKINGIKIHKKSLPVLRLHLIPSMGIDGPIAAHRWPSQLFPMGIDEPSMNHRWPSMEFELSPRAWGHLWSILGLNIFHFNLLSFPFEP